MSLHFPGLAVGRTVHYVMPDGEHRPAIVTKVWHSVSEEFQRQGYCNVQVIPDGANDDLNIRRLFNLGAESVPVVLRAAFPMSSVVFDEGCRPGTLHWPERE